MNSTDTTVPRSSLYRVCLPASAPSGITVAASSAHDAAERGFAAFCIPIGPTGIVTDYPKPGSYMSTMVPPELGELVVTKLPRERP